MTKDPYGWGSLMTNFPKSWQSQTKKSPWNPNVFHWLPYEFLWITETKLLKHRERKVKSLSCVRLFATPCTVAYQAPLSMGFSRQ